MAYFRVNEMLPGVFHLEDPRGVFITLLVGTQKALLVDTGMGMGNAAEEVRGLTDLPLTVCNTHGHIDHTGGNYQFERVLMSRADLELVKGGFPRQVKEHVAAMGGELPADFDAQAFYDYAFENVEPLDLEQSLDLGGLTVQPVPLPSHTPGSVGFYVPERKLLLSGDCIAPMVYLVFPESSSVADYVQVLKHARAVPAEWILSSHTGRLIPFSELEEYIACGEAATLEESVRRKDPLFPEYPGRMFIHEDKESGASAVLVFSPDKLERNE